LEKCGLAIFDQQRKLLRVVGMVADITERMRAEERLRESEAQFHDLAEQSRTTHWEVDPQGLFTYVSDVSQASWGYRPDEVVGRMHFYDLNPEEGREAFKATVFAVVEREQPFLDVVHAVETKDGRIMWGSTSGIPLRNADGTLRGYRGSCTDITERKLAHEALAGVSRKLIEAQEQERTRIGSELHDDIGQRLAMLAVELQQLHDNSLILPDVRSRMVEFQQRIVEMATDIQSLSHELHSAKLQYLGLAAAMRSFCQEFGERQKVEIDFKTHDLPSPLPPDITLCFFRVLQEALHNSAKHSGVRHFEVQLWGASDEIHLTVSDSGAGFDPETVKTSRGLGLISMEERLKLVNGTLSIESQPEKGTTVHVCVPLRSGSDSMRAAV
jgi:PAS domain S-box-containing protein